MNPKELVKTALTELFVNKDPAALKYFLGDKYIQHDPRGSGGADELVSVVLANTKSYRPYRYLRDGDHVVVHIRHEWNDRVEVYFSIIRVENGKLAEHWSVFEPEILEGAAHHEPQAPAGGKAPGANLEGLGQLDGPTEITDLNKTEANREFAKKFMDDILLNRRLDKIGEYLSDTDYTEHDYHVKSRGMGGVKRFADTIPFWKVTKCHRLFVEGNYFFIQCEGEVAAGVEGLVLDANNIQESARRFFSEGNKVEKVGNILEGENIHGGIGVAGVHVSGLAGENTLTGEENIRGIEERHPLGEMKMAKCAFGDLYRIENGRIVEHWDTCELIPAESKNQNGLF